MKEKNPIRRFRDFANSEPTVKERRIYKVIGTAIILSPLIYAAIKLLAK